MISGFMSAQTARLVRLVPLAAASEHATAAIFALIDVCCWSAHAVQLARGGAHCAAIWPCRGTYNALLYAFGGDPRATRFGALDSAVIWAGYCLLVG